ncbi:MAG: DUF4012 domain-containing protein, partial [Actinomycetes bacterium]
AELVDHGTLLPRHGRLDLSVVIATAPLITAVDTALRRAREKTAAIDTAGLVPGLARAVADINDRLDRLGRLTSAAAHGARVLPAILGADGPRDYLLLFQNLAEVRATGGIAGAYALVRADQGNIRIVEQGTAGTDLRAFERPVLTLDPAMASLYTDRLGRFPADVNLTPHFPTVAALAREMYRRRTGTTVDGVLATDPVALSYMLDGTSGLDVPGGPTLTAQNAARVRLSEVYLRPPGRQDSGPDDDSRSTDRYLTAVAAAAFSALTRDLSEPTAVIRGLARAIDERRMLAWSAHPNEQDAIAGTLLGGVMPLTDGDRPTVGLFLNDGSGAKLGYYLTRAADLAVTGCRSDGRRELRLTVRLGSHVPKTGLPPQVLGLGLAGDPYTIRTNVLLFSPAGGHVVDARI